MILLRFKLLMLMQELMSFQWANPRFFLHLLTPEFGISLVQLVSGLQIIGMALMQHWSNIKRIRPYFRKSLGELTQSLFP